MEMTIMVVLVIVALTFWSAYNNVLYTQTRDHDYWTKNQNLLSEKDLQIQNVVKTAIKNGQFDEAEMLHTQMGPNDRRTYNLEMRINLPNNTHLDCSLAMNLNMFRIFHHSSEGSCELSPADFNIETLAHLIDHEIQERFNQKDMRIKEALLASIK